MDLLIVDDEASLRDFLTIVFEEEGWRVDAAGSLGDMALAVKSATEAGTDEPLLVFDDATGAFVANYFYTHHESGLGRGFDVLLDFRR